MNKFFKKFTFACQKKLLVRRSGQQVVLHISKFDFDPFYFFQAFVLLKYRHKIMEPLPKDLTSLMINL